MKHLFVLELKRAVNSFKINIRDQLKLSLIISRLQLEGMGSCPCFVLALRVMVPLFNIGKTRHGWVSFPVCYCLIFLI